MGWFPTLQSDVVEMQKVATEGDGVGGRENSMNPAAWNDESLSGLYGDAMTFVHLIAEKSGPLDKIIDACDTNV